MRSNAARILIAEDEALIAEELSEKVSRMGLEVVGVVDTGEGAVRLAESAAPDLVLMDIRLKTRLDGIEAAGQIRERFGISVIYLTAHSDDATIERAAVTEPLGYLLKPVAERELQIALELGLQKDRADRKLRESEQRFSTTLASIADSVIATNGEGTVTFLNPAAERLTGWAREEAQGADVDRLLRILDEASETPHENPVRIALRTAEVVGLPENSVLLARDERRIPIEDSAAPIRDRKQDVRGAVVVLRDVSAIRQARLAVERAEERLRQSQRLEAIGRLAGGVAHDIGNLMTIIIGNADELMLDRAGGPTGEIVADIRDAGRRAAEISRQLLAFGARQLLSPSVVDLNTYLAETLPMLRRVIGASVDLVTDLAADVGRVRVDRGQLDQVLLNLAVNARFAMPSGGTLTLRTRVEWVGESEGADWPELHPGRHAALIVSDTGLGIDAQTLDHLFEPFYTTRPGEGSGLGLSTVYGIVKQSEGAIRVRSELGHGTVFEIRLREVADPVSPVEREPTPSPAPGSGRILVVDDEREVAQIARRVLERSGYEVHVAHGGAEAERWLASAERAPDLIVLDVTLGGESGVEVARRLAARHPGMRLLFVSTWVSRAQPEPVAGALRTGLLSKPYDPAQLLGAVQRLLDPDA